jgi:hypothetical protein
MIERIPEVNMPFHTKIKYKLALELHCIKFPPLPSANKLPFLWLACFFYSRDKGLIDMLFMYHFYRNNLLCAIYKQDLLEINKLKMLVMDYENLI